MPEVDVRVIDIARERESLPRYLQTLTPGERARADSYRFASDRDRFVCMRGVLREVLARHLAVAAGEIVFSENGYGKPFVRGGPEFSISYSRDTGLVAVASAPVGVDVERVDAGKVTAGMIEEVFNASEREAFPPAGGDPVDAFFRGWVRKESVLKAIGMGVSFPLHDVDSRLDSGSFAAAYGGVEYLTRDLTGCPGDYRAALTVARVRG